MLVKYQYNGILKIIFGIYTHCEAHSNSMVELHVGVGLLELQGDGFDSLPEALELHFLQLVPVGVLKYISFFTSKIYQLTTSVHVNAN